jgi:Domain of unknown function (DUF4350)
MSGEAVFSGRLLAGWIAGAVVVFAISLYLMGGGEVSGPESTGASTFSRSAVGHAGIADVLQRLGIAVVKSRYNSLEKLTPQSVLVIAEPRPGQQSEEAIRALLKADRILLVLPKWTGLPSEQSPGWIREARLRSTGEAAWALHLVAPRAQVVRDDGEVKWATNPLGPAPSLAAPTQLLRGGDLRPIVAADRGMLVGEISGRDRTIWVLSDPDLISNHGLARGANATLAIALIKRLRGADGSVVFDETVHGYVAKPASPLLLLFDFPFVVATAQGLIAVGLLLWATMARFGAPQPLPPPLSAGRGGLLQNMAKLIELNGHQQIMVRRYVQETVRDVARQLHAPRGLSGDALLAWLQRVGTARAVEINCRALMDGADKLGAPQRRDSSSLVRLARDAHRWKGEILDGRSRHPRNH